MPVLDRCGRCGSLDVQAGLDTVQCLRPECAWITRNDGVMVSPDERFTETIHNKHHAADQGEVPIEGR
jgi:hypothetical protein